MTLVLHVVRMAYLNVIITRSGHRIHLWSLLNVVSVSLIRGQVVRFSPLIIILYQDVLWSQERFQIMRDLRENHKLHGIVSRTISEV